MFNFSSKTIVNKEMKAADVLRTIHADREAREDASCIKSIVLENVLKAETLNCEQDPEFKEIYVFEIQTNKDIVPSVFLKSLDLKVNFHTFYVIKSPNKTTCVICFKEIGKTNKLGKYYTKECLDDVVDVPYISSVPEAYKFLYSFVLNVPYRESETPKELQGRINVIRKAEYDIEQLEKAIVYTAQPKKKFEYHQKIKLLKEKLEEALRGN